MKYLIPIFLLVFLIFPLIVNAQCTRIDAGRVRDLCTLISDIAYILQIFGIALALIVIVVSGIQYMTAGGDQEKVTKAKKTLTYGLVGVAIVFAAYFIIQLIEDFLVTRGLT